MSDDPQAAGLIVGSGRRAELIAESGRWRSWTLSGRQLTEFEALASGFLAPLQGYERTALHVTGARAGSPVAAGAAGVTLDVAAILGSRLRREERLALRDPEGALLGVLTVHDATPAGEVWQLTGPIEGVEPLAHEDFRPLRLDPASIGERIRALGRPSVLAYLPGEVLHGAMRAAIVDAANRLDAAILALIPSGAADPDDLRRFARIRALEIATGLLPPDRTVAAVVPIPDVSPTTSTLVHGAIMARNCGAAWCGFDADQAHGSEAALPDVPGLTFLPLQAWAYSRSSGRLVHPDTAEPGLEHAPSAAAILSRLSSGTPGWLLTGAELNALRRAHPEPRDRGFTVFFTGLSGSGKSTIARALRVRLMELTGRAVTMLDGDVVRRHLSSELGFSREHRDLNVLRIGWVASEITRHGGIAVCAPIAPYEAIRRQVRQLIAPLGGFVLVHVSTPLETCEARDRKGLYARARAGELPQFTGVSDPYEMPLDADITIDTRGVGVDAACATIIDALARQGYLG